MSFAPFAASAINLRTDRVAPEDAARQQRSAQEILCRLAQQPGVVLADEVGMGKTFVAMAVAASILLQRPDDGPVVVMSPPTLKQKWPKDWEVFCEKCLSPAARQQFGYKGVAREATSGIEFLRLLDDPPAQRARVIFLTHGALHRALTDGFARLAVIKRAFKGRSSLAEQRRNFWKFAGRLLQMQSGYERLADGLLGDLLERPYESWLRAIHRAHPELKKKVEDDPVPRDFYEALEAMEGERFEPLVAELRRLPLRESTRVDERLKEIRRVLAGLMNDIWSQALRRARFRSPLLIFDEAHHLKNPATRLASLFIHDDQNEPESACFEQGGALGGKFERMLFLTATPFQLGHHELINVLQRFAGIAWDGAQPPALARQAFGEKIAALKRALDDAQAAALRLDRAWGRLTAEHLLGPDGQPLPVDDWWHRLQTEPGEGIAAQIVEQVGATRAAMSQAEAQLRPWVLRHRKSKDLPMPPNVISTTKIERRRLLPGAAIRDEAVTEAGLEITGEALFPFLLAGRAQALLAATARGRALFAEGLASSFEAYRETRASQMPEEDPDLQDAAAPAEINWYLDHLNHALPSDGEAAWQAHPKIRATAARAVQLWSAGEKVLIFCHYRATGRALRRHISAQLDAEIIRRGQQQLTALDEQAIRDELDRLGDRFFNTGGALRHEVTEALRGIVQPFAFAAEQRERIIEVTRRFLRTPSFLVRYFDLTRADCAEAFAAAIERQDVGGMSLRRRIEEFCCFLAERCAAGERDDYLDALSRIQPGSLVGREAAESFEASEGLEELQHRRRLPNVRLANGEVKDETRRRLLLAFNTPLFPEILIASSVLAEGVDLHLHCRYVIHHDLCWNPSTLEQRTGRVDRIGSKAERVGQSIHVYLPYVAATQDEKMYRVVRDRERWFQIVMGDKYEVDEAETDRRAARIPLPRAILNDLMLRLEAPEAETSPSEPDQPARS